MKTKEKSSAKSTVRKSRIIKTWHIILICVIVFFIALRLALPFILFKYFNKVLSEMKGYKGSIESFDLELIRGGYYVGGFKIEKIEGKIPVPFIYSDKIALHIEWAPIFKSFDLVAELELINPKFNFVKGPTKETSQTGTEGDWTTPLKKLKAFTINKLSIENGQVFYYDFHSKPKVDLSLKKIQLLVTNLKNVESKNTKLPSHLDLTAVSIGDGKLHIKADLNVLKEVPDFDVNFSFTKVHIPALNDFTNAYGKFDFEKGEFSLFAEAALDDSYLKGYAQPMLENVKVLNWKNEKDENNKEEGFFRKLWEGLVGTAVKITQNQSKDRFATKIPFEGNIKNVKTEIWPTIIGIFKNEFIKAFPKSLDNSVDINSTKDKNNR